MKTQEKRNHWWTGKRSQTHKKTMSFSKVAGRPISLPKSPRWRVWMLRPQCLLPPLLILSLLAIFNLTHNQGNDQERSYIMILLKVVNELESKSASDVVPQQICLYISFHRCPLKHEKTECISGKEERQCNQHLPRPVLERPVPHT